MSLIFELPEEILYELIIYLSNIDVTNFRFAYGNEIINFYEKFSWRDMFWIKYKDNKYINKLIKYYYTDKNVELDDILYEQLFGILNDSKTYRSVKISDYLKLTFDGKFYYEDTLLYSNVLDIIQISLYFYILTINNKLIQYDIRCETSKKIRNNVTQFMLVTKILVFLEQGLIYSIADHDNPNNPIILTENLTNIKQFDFTGLYLDLTLYVLQNDKTLNVVELDFLKGFSFTFMRHKSLEYKSHKSIDYKVEQFACNKAELFYINNKNQLYKYANGQIKFIKNVQNTSLYSGLEGVIIYSNYKFNKPDGFFGLIEI